MPARRPHKRASACRHRKSARSDADLPEPAQRLPRLHQHYANHAEPVMAVAAVREWFRSRQPGKRWFQSSIPPTSLRAAPVAAPQKRLGLSGLQCPHPPLPPLLGLRSASLPQHRNGWVFGPILEAPGGIPPSPLYTYTQPPEFIHCTNLPLLRTSHPSPYSPTISFLMALCTHTEFFSFAGFPYTHSFRNYFLQFIEE
jgi:hypothetical protein